MATVFSIRKSQEDRSPISKHLDEWERISRDDQEKRLGPDWFDQMENLYQLIDQGGPMPSFRPLVRITDLQTLMLQEANDLSDVSPQIFVTSHETGKREKDRESALQSEWKRAKINYHAMYAMLWSLYSGMAPLQFHFDPDLRNGRGGFWAKARDPRTFLFDPAADYEQKFSYTIFLDRMHIEDIRSRWPQTSIGLKPRATQGRLRSPSVGEAGYGFQMPDGPMSLMPGLPASRTFPNDNRLTVRHVYCHDYTREKVEDGKLPKGAITPPEFVWKFPNGRWITDCEGRVLADGDNWCPFRNHPVVLFFSAPPLYGLYPPPAVRFSQDMQNVAQKMYSGLTENAIRLNNGVWFIDERTGINPNLFGGIPGEVQVINANSPEPKCVTPPAWPAHFLDFPKHLLDKQRENQGRGDARQGKVPAGNVSAELSDASAQRQQGITQLRTRLAADAFDRLAQMMFYTMGRYMGRQYLPLRGSKTGDSVLWDTLQRPDQFDVWMDESLAEVMSGSVMSRLAPELMKGGALPLKAGLKALKWPDAEAVAEEREREMSLQAIGRVKGNKK